MTKDERTDRLARAAERVYVRWEREHPDATSLEKLAAVYRISNRILRHGR